MLGKSQDIQRETNTTKGIPTPVKNMILGLIIARFSLSIAIAKTSSGIAGSQGLNSNNSRTRAVGRGSLILLASLLRYSLLHILALLLRDINASLDHKDNIH